jgi:hypothetical protein
MAKVAKPSTSLTNPASQPATETMQTTRTAGDGAPGASTCTPLQAAAQLLTQFSYNTGYYVSYGVVYPTLLLVKIIPGARALLSGFVDGAAAANEHAHRLPAESATRITSVPNNQSQQVAMEMA